MKTTTFNYAAVATRNASDFWSVAAETMANVSVARQPWNYLDLPAVFCYSSQVEKGTTVIVKARLVRLCIALIALVTFSMITTGRATVVTFDDLSETGSGSYIPTSYQGLVWSNFGAYNAILDTNLPPIVGGGLSGLYYGMVSPSNAASGGFLGLSEIDSSTNFNFLSAYLTGAWNSNLNIEVQGFNGPTMLYDTTVVASATSPTLFTFDYLNVDRLTFDSFGGQSAGFSGGGQNFVMDNFTFDFVPEPSAFLLTVAGGLTLWAFLNRKRVT